MQHYGLYFTPEHIQTALKQRQRDPFAQAFKQLIERPTSGNASLLQAGYLWKTLQNHAAGASAIMPLERAFTQNLTAYPHVWHTVSELVALIHAFELLRDHPDFEPSVQARCIDAANEQAASLHPSADTPDSWVETLWIALLHTATGIMTDQPALLRRGVDVFESAITNEVRPQGFMPKAVDAKDGGNMMRQILASSALVLIAETAAHSGESYDLWNYAVRGVSVVTTAIYPIYYFYTTEKWKWDAEIAPETVQQLFRQYGGYLEIAHQRTGLKDLYTVLSDLRPLFDVSGGGYTTLTHGVPVRRGLFG